MQPICLTGISKSFGDHVVLRDFSLTMQPGERLALMAPSGSGKTTLFNIMLGLSAADAGTITGIPERVSVVFQEDRLLEAFPAAANLRAAVPRPAGGEGAVLRLLEELGLRDAADLPAAKLSGGMRQRLALARAILYGGDLFLLDEPFKGLDADTRRDTARVLLARTSGKTILCATHDPEDARLLGAGIITLKGQEGSCAFPAPESTP